ncbi:membrane lipoprotein lipid attachment site-containing protein [Halalkalibacter alkalisediminis]|uniref:Membrane lipoprotein lipid attachment site-containing protein n=1 Tax=Halalkalibacter alkalisediminis TaxID=935616 RepID=A0ABV6NQ08_9BACI|nr:membrane lipoprotein lipid attachment site-containing protein [Halalkalibacter alkalisediminis]
MKKILLILLSIVTLSGCNANSSLSFSEVSQESINKDIRSFFQGVKEENGVHLYLDKKNNAVFVYLNGSNVIQDEKAVYFTGFDIESENDTLNLLYKSEETSDYSNSSLEHEIFYKVNLDKYYEEVKLLNNGNETSFGTISGNN